MPTHTIEIRAPARAGRCKRVPKSRRRGPAGAMQLQRILLLAVLAVAVTAPRPGEPAARAAAAAACHCLPPSAGACLGCGACPPRQPPTSSLQALESLTTRSRRQRSPPIQRQSPKSSTLCVRPGMLIARRAPAAARVAASLSPAAQPCAGAAARRRLRTASQPPRAMLRPRQRQRPAAACSRCPLPCNFSSSAPQQALSAA